MPTQKVRYEELLPAEFEERLAQRPVGYLPLGTLEWHGPHLALGADAHLARGLFERAARTLGGIVFPPVWVGPDLILGRDSASDLIGVDLAPSTRPHRQLPGSLYWVPTGLFLALLEAILGQAARAGFRCIVADGHNPSRAAWAEMVEAWEHQFGLKLVPVRRAFGDAWPAQTDHAGKNETSMMMAVAPELVAIDRLPATDDRGPDGVEGEDPRHASADLGEEILERAVALLGPKLDKLGI